MQHIISFPPTWPRQWSRFKSLFQLNLKQFAPIVNKLQFIYIYFYYFSGQQKIII